LQLVKDDGEYHQPAWRTARSRLNQLNQATAGVVQWQNGSFPILKTHF
jgi:hypothetical protein